MTRVGLSCISLTGTPRRRERRGGVESALLAARGRFPAGSSGIVKGDGDGFRIAEEDLRLRGPGELLGTRQHGLPAFKVADVTEDFHLLEQAREDAASILRADPRLAQRDHAALRGALQRHYGAVVRFIDVA